MPTKEWTLTGTQEFTALLAGALAQRDGWGEAFADEVKRSVTDNQYWVAVCLGMIAQRDTSIRGFVKERFNNQRDPLLTSDYMEDEDFLPVIIDGAIKMEHGDKVRRERQEDTE